MTKTIGFLMLLTSAAWAGKEGGGIDSGGGIFVQTSKKCAPALADLVWFDSSFCEKPSSARLPRREALTTLGIDRLEVQELGPAYQLALERLALWRSTSPETVNQITKAIASMSWYMIPFHQKVRNAAAELQEIHGKSSIEAAVTYERGLGARVSLPGYEGAGETSQSALIIHEGLRMAQVELRRELSEATIWTTTARIALTEPQGNESLDSEETRDPLNVVLDRRQAVADQLLDCENTDMDCIHKFYAQYETYTSQIMRMIEGEFENAVSPELIQATRSLIPSKLDLAIDVINGKRQVRVRYRNDLRKLKKELRAQIARELESDKIWD